MTTTKQKPEPAPIYTANDLIKIRNDLPLDTIKGYLPGLTTSIHFGHGGSLKSYLALDMAMALTLGKPWLGMSVIQTPVLYIDLENEKELQGQRVYSVMRGHQLQHPPDNLHFVFRMQNRLDKSDVVGEIGYYVQGTNAKLVILDSLVDFWGEWDENSNGDMSKAAERMRAISSMLRVGVFGIHHTAWSTDQRPRGATALYNGVTLNTMVKRDGQFLRLKQQKNRRGREIEITARLNLDHDLFNLSPAGAIVPTTTAPTDPVEIAILELLDGGARWKSNDLIKEVAGIVNRSRPNVTAKLAKMRDSLKINTQSNGNGIPYTVWSDTET